MNELLTQLYSNAAEYAFNQRFIPGTPRPLQEVINEKFAELIVLESARIIQAEKDTGLYNQQVAAGMTASKAVIKDHFGVK